MVCAVEREAEEGERGPSWVVWCFGLLLTSWRGLVWRCCAGSAAIYGLRGKKNINVFMLFPKGRVSEVQEKQMTTVLDDNVHCIAIDVRTAHAR